MGSSWVRPDFTSAVDLSTASALPARRTKAAQPAGPPPPSAAARRKKARPPSGPPPPTARCPRHRKKTLRQQKSCRVAVGTWNIGAELPSHEMLCRYFSECAVTTGTGEPTPDVWILGFQETVELSPQNIVMGASNPGCNARTGELVVACEAAITALFGAQIPHTSSSGGLATKGLGAKQRAAAKVLEEVLAQRSAKHFVTVAMERLVGLVSLLIVRASSLFTSSKNISRVKSRILPLGKKISGVKMGNKGACCFSFLMFGTTSVSFVTSHIAAHRAKVNKRIEHYNIIVDTVNFDAAVRDEADDKAAMEREAAEAEAAALDAIEHGDDGSVSDSESEEEEEVEDAGKKQKKKRKKKQKKKQKKKKGEGKLDKFRAKMNLAGRKVFSATRGLGTLTHSLSAPGDVRTRIAMVNTAMREEAKARKALEKPPAEVPDPENPGEFLGPLVLVEPRLVLEHDVAFFTGDLNFRLRPLLADDDDCGVVESSSEEVSSSSGDEDDERCEPKAVPAVDAEDAMEKAEPKDAKEHSSRKECKGEYLEVVDSIHRDYMLCESFSQLHSLFPLTSFHVRRIQSRLRTPAQSEDVGARQLRSAARCAPGLGYRYIISCESVSQLLTRSPYLYDYAWSRRRALPYNIRR